MDWMLFALSVKAAMEDILYSVERAVLLLCPIFGDEI